MVDEPQVACGDCGLWHARLGWAGLCQPCWDVHVMVVSSPTYRETQERLEAVIRERTASGRWARILATSPVDDVVKYTGARLRVSNSTIAEMHADGHALYSGTPTAARLERDCMCSFHVGLRDNTSPDLGASTTEATP